MKLKKIKRSSHPVMFFIYLFIFVVILSGILDVLNVQVTYDKLTTVAGQVDPTTVSVNSIFKYDGLKFLITSAYNNLKTFVPFGALLMASIAFGIALKSGFLKTLCGKLTKKIPKAVIVFLYALICIIASIDSNVGYVLLLPLGAVLFMSMNRNALGGLALGFAAISAGHGVGLFVTATDYNLSSYTEASAKLLDATYAVEQNSNLIFIIVASLLIAGICTLVTERFTVRRLGRNTIVEEDELMFEESDERRGLIAVLIATVLYIIPIILMLIPSSGNGFIGLLLDKSQSSYVKMVFSNDTLLTTNMVGIVSLLFAIQGFVFGVATKTIKKIRDMVNFATDYLRSIGGIFVLIFFASQLIALVNETGIDIVITSALSNLVSNLEFSFIPLVLLLLLISLISNIFLPGSVAKWSIIAPNVMPVIMKANITPEFAQIVFRAGDSITNMITPLFVYFVIYIGFIEVYTKNSSEFSIRNCYRMILPYFISIAAVWLFMIICWYVIGIPIGPGITPTL